MSKNTTPITVVSELSLNELCRATNMPSEILIEIIEEGIIEPIGTNSDNWLFSSHTITIVQKARRLQHDLNINWAGIALSISLLEEVEQLREDNKRLKQRLQRFTSIEDY